MNGRCRPGRRVTPGARLPRVGRRVFAIGLDSASVDLVDRLVDVGILPNFATLRDRASRRRLRSGDGHRHGTLWAQFVADTELALDRPGFRCSFDPDTYAAYEEPARHELAGRVPSGRRPAAPRSRSTFPAPPSRDPACTSPAGVPTRRAIPGRHGRSGLLREIDRRFGPHPAAGNEHDCGWHDPDRLERLTRALEAGAVRRADVAGFLMQRFPDWELFVTVMSESHAAAELMWHGVDVDHVLADVDVHAGRRLTRVYRAMDRGSARSSPPSNPTTRCSSSRSTA